LPSDSRIYNKAQDGLTKNDHIREMVQQAAERNLKPELVAFESWSRDGRVWMDVDKPRFVLRSGDL
jgi:hypothetical protein